MAQPSGWILATGRAKLCVMCGVSMVRTRRVAACWESLQYCSAACRRMARSGTETQSKIKTQPLPAAESSAA